MDVRFSNNGGLNNPKPDFGVISNTKPVEANNVKISNLHSSVELKKLENQGVSVTVGEEQIVKALEKALKALEGPNTALEVSIHKETQTIMVKILNKETGELIREVPPEKTLDLVANMMEIAGIIVDERI
ncbi:flagellar protein FlaG [Paenibacillus wynnii]|uniref:flagellar protein FlaG n=1 Tax=Paenibacillus wynnii TaxID=268407 RepID=UPI0027935514|nr:flagellar protein FlaG [Paenibacillus wynnii]MDQ0192180.1 flagellar protein FlaG [Paenibacillus wynnii]